MKPQRCPDLVRDSLAQIDRPRIAHRHRKALDNGRLRGQAVRRGDPGRQRNQLRMQGDPIVRRQRAQRALYRHAIGNDVVGGAGVDFGNRHHHWVGHRKAACDHCLDRGDDFAGDRHRVERLMRHRGMAAAPLDRHFEPISRRHQRAGPPRHQSVRAVGHDMQRKRGIGQRIKQAVIEHEPRAVKALFARLKHEHHIARKTVAACAQHMRCARQHRRMGVMAARMHCARHMAGKC